MLHTVVFRLEFTKKRPKTNLNIFQKKVLNSIKRSEKQLASKVNFKTFLQLSCYSYKNCERN